MREKFNWAHERIICEWIKTFDFRAKEEFWMKFSKYIAFLWNAFKFRRCNYTSTSIFLPQFSFFSALHFPSIVRMRFFPRCLHFLYHTKSVPMQLRESRSRAVRKMQPVERNTWNDIFWGAHHTVVAPSQRRGDLLLEDAPRTCSKKIQ